MRAEFCPLGAVGSPEVGNVAPLMAATAYQERRQGGEQKKDMVLSPFTTFGPHNSGKE